MVVDDVTVEFSINVDDVRADDVVGDANTDLVDDWSFGGNNTGSGWRILRIRSESLMGVLLEFPIVSTPVRFVAV